MSSSEWAVSALTAGFLAASAGLFTKAASESTAILKYACSWMPKDLRIARLERSFCALYSRKLFYSKLMVANLVKVMSVRSTVLYKDFF